jgi:hypothetical protein
MPETQMVTASRGSASCSGGGTGTGCSGTFSASGSLRWLVISRKPNSLTSPAGPAYTERSALCFHPKRASCILCSAEIRKAWLCLTVSFDSYISHLERRSPRRRDMRSPTARAPMAPKAAAMPTELPATPAATPVAAAPAPTPVITVPATAASAGAASPPAWWDQELLQQQHYIHDRVTVLVPTARAGSSAFVQ